MDLVLERMQAYLLTFNSASHNNKTMRHQKELQNWGKIMKRSVNNEFKRTFFRSHYFNLVLFMVAADYNYASKKRPYTKINQEDISYFASRNGVRLQIIFQSTLERRLFHTKRNQLCLVCGD